MCTLITDDFKVKIGDIDITGGIVAGGGSPDSGSQSGGSGEMEG